ncbi:DNA repair protein complementing XP-C cells-like, partial [Symbiodinium microadriaticum]
MVVMLMLVTLVAKVDSQPALVSDTDVSETTSEPPELSGVYSEDTPAASSPAAPAGADTGASETPPRSTGEAKAKEPKLPKASKDSEEAKRLRREAVLQHRVLSLCCVARLVWLNGMCNQELLQSSLLSLAPDCLKGGVGGALQHLKTRLLAPSDAGTGKDGEVQPSLVRLLRALQGFSADLSAEEWVLLLVARFSAAVRLASAPQLSPCGYQKHSWSSANLESAGTWSSPPLVLAEKAFHEVVEAAQNKREQWKELRNHVAGRCGKAPHALWELTPRLVRLLEAISVLHGMKTQAQLLYPWSSVAERRPPKPSTNAMSRLLHMDMVMDMQAGKAVTKKAADPKKKAPEVADKKAEEAARKKEKKAARKEKAEASLTAAREQELQRAEEAGPEALKAWKKQHNEVTWSKKKASLAVLRQKEKEDEQAARTLRDKRRADKENAANSRARKKGEERRTELRGSWGILRADRRAPGEALWVLAMGPLNDLWDVTRRYARWSVVSQARGSLAKPWEEILRRFRWPETLKEFPGLQEANAFDEKRLGERASKEPLPNSRVGFRHHRLYVLNSQLKQSQIVQSTSPVGLFQGKDPIWRREDVKELLTASKWRQQGRVIRTGERPTKVLRSNSLFSSQLFGLWQTEEHSESFEDRARDFMPGFGPIPTTNNYGNIEVKNGLPKGTVHLTDDGVKEAALKLGVEFAPAVTGFQSERGVLKPTISGCVVWERDVEDVLRAAEEERDRLEQVKEAQKRERLKGAWQLLVKHVLLDLYVEQRYGSGGPSFVRKGVLCNTCRENGTTPWERCFMSLDPGTKDCISMVAELLPHEPDFSMNQVKAAVEVAVAEHPRLREVLSDCGLWEEVELDLEADHLRWIQDAGESKGKEEDPGIVLAMQNMPAFDDASGRTPRWQVIATPRKLVFHVHHAAVDGVGIVVITSTLLFGKSLRETVQEMLPMAEKSRRKHGSAQPDCSGSCCEGLTAMGSCMRHVGAPFRGLLFPEAKSPISAPSDAARPSQIRYFHLGPQQVLDCR